MEVKEAIEFIGDVLIVADMKEYDFDDSPGLVDRLQNLDIEDNFKEVIDLLQQGEKYRQMWSSYRSDVIECSDAKTYYNIILPLEQKYFPKEAKHDRKYK